LGFQYSSRDIPLPMRACHFVLGEVLRLLHDGGELRDDHHGPCSHSLHSICNTFLPQTSCSQIRAHRDWSERAGAVEAAVGLNWTPHEQHVKFAKSECASRVMITSSKTNTSNAIKLSNLLIDY